MVARGWCRLHEYDCDCDLILMIERTTSPKSGEQSCAIGARMLVAFTCMASCASPPPMPGAVAPTSSEAQPIAPVETAPQLPAESEQASPRIALEPSPIAIPNARFYQGYVLGGLPSNHDLDAAMSAGFESAMSLMTNDEEGGPELARYGASKGLRYLRFTIAGKEDLNESMAWQFASTESMLGKPAIIHSLSGQRVAAIFVLRAYFVDELSADEALAIGDALGMGEFAEHVRQELANNPR